MMRRCWVGGMLVCLLASALLAKQGIVKTNDGRTLQGDVKENSPDAQSVSITIHGVVVTLPRSDILSIDYANDFAARFHARLAALGPVDVKARLDLSRWALDNKQYDLATEAAENARRIDPGNPDVTIMLNTIDSQKAIDARQASGAAHAAGPAPATRPNVAAATTAASEPSMGGYLTMSDVYAIRRAELLPDDNVEVQFLDNVRTRFLSRFGGDAAEFNKESPTEQALDVIGSDDPALQRSVQILSDPRVLAYYHTRVQPVVLAGCAASSCHGQAGAGGFFLFPNAERTPAAYTNFFILQNTRRKLAGPEIFGRAEVVRPMIDRIHPEASLILQFGLPTSQASTPHPKAAGWRPIFAAGDQDPAYQEIYQWITSLKAIEPVYGLKYQIPATRPAANQ